MDFDGSMKRRTLVLIALAAVLTFGIRPVLSWQAGWRPLSLAPVQSFARVSQSGDIDEGKFTSLNSFLSAAFRSTPDAGLPGTDAPSQPYRRHPYGLALSSDETKLYVTFEGNEAEPASAVAVIDTARQALRTEIRVGLKPLGIARTPGGRYLVVANQLSNYLFYH